MESGLDISQNNTGTNTFKVVIIGDKSIGKTCIIKRFQDNTYSEHEEMTLGAQFYAKKMKASYTVGENMMEINNRKSAPSRQSKQNVPQDPNAGQLMKGDVKIQLWDTAGEERFRALTPMYYKSAEAILLAFSLIDSETFENLPKWIREID